MRIVGGIYRSRILRAPTGQATRPTSDRVRESLFGLLDAASLVAGARVADLYAGTGALGLEAVSRGAVRAIFVEHSPEALRVLRDNVAALGVEAQVQVVAADVGRAARRLAALGPFDLVLADPPWSLVETGDAPAALARVVDAGALAEGARVVVEHAARSAAPVIAGLVAVEVRRYGDAALAIYKPAILGPPRLQPSSPTSG